MGLSSTEELHHASQHFHLGAAAALLASANTFGAATPAVHDEAGFFKPETVTAANKIISDIKRDEKKDLSSRRSFHAPEGKEQEAENKDTKATFFKNGPTNSCTTKTSTAFMY